MITVLKRNKNIAIFISIISLIGLITGYKFYSLQPEETKTSIITKIDIKENLSYKTNNMLKDMKDIIIIFISCILILPIIINIFNIFYKSFQIGFLFNILNNIGTKLTLVYITIYKIIPFIFLTILTIISFKITLNIIRLLLFKKNEYKLQILRYLKYFFIISFILLIYEFIIFIYSEIINNYCISLL